MWWAEEDVARTEKAMMVVSSYVLYFSEEFVFWIRERKVRKVRPRLIFCVKSKMFLNFMVQLYMEVINSLLVRDDESTLFRGVSFQMRIRKPPRFSFSHSLSSLSLSQYKLSLSLLCVCVTKTLKNFTLSLSLYFSTLVRRRRLRRTPPLPPTRLGIADTR